MSEAEVAATPAEALEIKGEEEGEGESDSSASANPLSTELIGDNLSLLCKTGNGVAHAYVRLDVPDKEITDIEAIKTFKYLRYLDISKNRLTDIGPISSLSEVIVINASSNEIVSLAGIAERRYLQVVNVSNNKLASIDGLNFQRIEIMNVANNEIDDLSSFKCDALSQLRVLDLSGNKLTSTGGLVLPSIQSLYVGKNSITSLADIIGLKNLETLNARGNKLETLTDIAECMPRLKYLNLRENNIANKEDVYKLACHTALETLVLIDNPVRDTEDYRIDMLVNIPSLLRLDKEAYTEDEVFEANQIRAERQAELEAEAAKEGEDEDEAVEE